MVPGSAIVLAVCCPNVGTLHITIPAWLSNQSPFFYLALVVSWGAGMVDAGVLALEGVEMPLGRGGATL